MGQRTHSTWLSGLTRTGLMADVAYSGLRRVWAGRLVYSPEWFWWSAPWVDALLVALVTIVVVPLVPRAWSMTMRFAFPAGLLAAGLLLFVPGLHPVALLLFAVGFGTSAGGYLARHAPTVDRLMLWSLPVSLVVLPAVGAVAFRLRGPEHGPSIQAPRPDLPNILIIVLDTVRAIELSLYGGRGGTTPVMDGIGNAGVVFERASSTAPWTLPSHASLFTGRWAHELSATLLTPLDDTYPTLAEVLASLGYRTGGFSANVEYASAETGVARGFGHFEDHRWSVRGTLRLTRLSRFFAAAGERVRRGPVDIAGRVDAALVNRRFLRWVGDRDERPFFAFLNYYDAHAPYYPPEPIWSDFVGAVPRVPLDNPDSEAGDGSRVELLRRAYGGAIHYIDWRIGQLMDSLRAGGLYDNTLIVITSDHGEEFSEHGVLGHGNTLYLPSVHVPLILAWPERLPAGCRIGAPVSIRDVPATIMDLIEAPGPFPGRRLTDLWERAHPADWESSVLTHTQRAINQPPHLPASRGPLFGAEVWPHRLLVESDPVSISLFDLASDPQELNDLWTDPPPDVALRLLAELGAVGAPTGRVVGTAPAAGSAAAAGAAAASGCVAG
jgi:arylsulfatase A-like enzyme